MVDMIGFNIAYIPLYFVDCYHGLYFRSTRVWENQNATLQLVKTKVA